MKRYTFSKKEHICKRNEFKQLVLKGKSFYVFPFRCFYIINSSNEYKVKFAVTVPKRNIQQAAKRNYIKRITRESYRLNKHILHDYIENKPIEVLLLCIYIHKNKLPFHTVEISIKSLLNKMINLDLINELKNTNNNAN